MGLNVKIKTKTAELTGASLDEAVAKAEGWIFKTGITAWYGNKPWLEYYDKRGTTRRQLWQLAFSTDWKLSGPIIEREGISVGPWSTRPFAAHRGLASEVTSSNPRMVGPTMLISAMRCYVASKLGDEVEVPEELLC